MDDLAGLDWSAPANKSTTPAAFPPIRQTPPPQLSGRSTPLSAQQSGSTSLPLGGRVPKPPSKPATPANDSFASLVNLNGKPATSGLSLQERQRQLQAEKAQQEADRNKQYATHFGGSAASFLDNIGSGKNTPGPAAPGLRRPSPNGLGSQNLSKTINKPFANLDTGLKRSAQPSPAHDDLLAAFHSAAPVDASSHFPPPSADSGRATPATSTYASRGHTPVPASSNGALAADDDDMFGLNQLTQKPTSGQPAAATSPDADDDILGLLGKPVSDFETKRQSQGGDDTAQHGAPEAQSDTQTPHDKAVKELVDMGFPPEKSAIALATTESGLNVQEAVSWLLNQAHAEAKKKPQSRRVQDVEGRLGPEDAERQSERPREQDRARDASEAGSRPAWMRAEEGRSRSGQRRTEGTAQEKDVSQYASELGSTFLKSANSLWKTGQKKVQKAVAEFQQDGDPSVPKWMKEAQSAEHDRNPRSASPRTNGSSQAATDEARMLDGGGRPSRLSRAAHTQREPEMQAARPKDRVESHSERRDSVSRSTSQSPSIFQQQARAVNRPAAKLTRQDVEEQSSQAYVSPARRKKTTPQPDLLAPTSTAASPPVPLLKANIASNNPFRQATTPPISRSPAAVPLPTRPKAPPRRIPPASSSALSSSASYRQKGSEAFKRGDYGAAHAAYTAAMGPLPQDHPVAIIVLCNLAVTNVKIGDPKAAVSNADAALTIIGPSRGEGEKIAPGGTDADKDMKEFFGKALMRKAEALEHMERWAEAGKVWKEAVEAGVGGAISIQGRNRCDKASGNGPATTNGAPARKLPARQPPPPKKSALSDLGSSSTSVGDSEAVKKLKAANAAAERADDEKFALTDQVDAKLVAWKGSKSDNLRALLGSLDKVLWPEAGWNKVGMGDLVMPNKVKIAYMKAIAKVHPDKISQTATTEQRMISAAVFATLNEAWDKFKKDNGL